MHPSSVPIPEGDQAYTFPETLIEAYLSRQCEQAKTEEGISVGLPVLEYIDLPMEESTRMRSVVHSSESAYEGKPLLLLEPHADDVALSLWGTLLTWSRPVIVVTIFSRSQNLAPPLRKQQDLPEAAVTELRMAEVRASLQFLNGQHYSLDIPERPFPHREAPRPGRIDLVCERLEPLIDRHADAELAAPFCMSRHPDHHAVRAAAETFGCTLFWEDVDFYPNYARLRSDEEFGFSEWGSDCNVEYVDVTRMVFEKMAALSVYQSQCYPFEDMWGPLRFNWATARRGIRCGELSSQARYAERLFRAA